jgi:hypothetical protein
MNVKGVWLGGINKMGEGEKKEYWKLKRIEVEMDLGHSRRLCELHESWTLALETLLA